MRVLGGRARKEAMKKIVDMKERIEGKRQKERLDRYRDRAESIRTMVQCSSCHFRCAMCGRQAQRDDASAPSRSKTLGLTLCKDCGAEFEDYLAISRGEKEPDLPWHNEQWLNIWSAWLNYRKAITAFVASPEFKGLVDEINRDS
jgi:NAD-dependent SIR2 family protein deacetylase